MTTLVEALQATSWHFLITIGRRRRLKLDSNLPKAELIDILSRALVQPDNLRPALAGLSAPARQLLVDLQLAGGRVARRHLAASSGRLRPAREIIRTLRQQARAAQAVYSPLEEVTLLGLIFLDQAADDLFIPAELLPLLPPPPAIPLPTPARQARPSAPVDLVCHDLAYLFGLLQRHDIAPRHGRWLPPNLLLAWGRGCLGPVVHPQARGELQTGRRRFLHYLAENAGWLNYQLVMNNTHRALREQISRSTPHAPRSPLHAPRSTPHAPRSTLTPTPTAWLWLNASAQERRQALWQSWLSPDPARWRAFRLPGSAWLSQPEALLVVIHDYLPRLDPADPAEFARLLLARQPELLDLLPANLLEPAKLLAETIVQMLTGPLVWLGALWTETGAGDSGSQPQALSLTLEGLAWLRGEPLPAESTSRYAKFSIKPDFQPEPLDSTITLTLQAGLPEPVDLVTAMEMSETCQVFKTWQVYTLTAPSLIEALHRGWSPPALLDALNRLAGRPLTGQETALLRAWADAAGKMTIHPAVILETADPDIISRLAATRRGRALIQRTLSPRAVVVDPARLDLLVQRLIEQEGVPPKDEGGGMKDEAEPISSLIPHPSSFLWLAIEVYQRLSQFIRLPARIPQSVIDQLSPRLTPTDLAAVDVAAGQVLAALEQAIDGRAAFPPWSGEGLPVEESVPVIETALRDGLYLELDYYSAGRDELTHRLVEPYRLEWRGRAGAKADRPSGTPYLVGFCRRAQSERVFRVDRIRGIALVPAPDD